MDACIHLHLSRLPQDPRLEVRQDVFNWAGVDYPQGPEYFLWGGRIKIQKGLALSYPRRRMPPGLTMAVESFVRMTIPGEELDRYEAEEPNGDEVNSDDDEVDLDGALLDDLFQQALTRDTDWVASFLPQCDEINDVYRGDASMFLKILRNNVRPGGSHRGFCVFHSASSR